MNQTKSVDMSHAFAKDSRACAACVSWGGARTLASDNTLVQVERYSIEGECRTAASQDYRRITKAYHTCGRWAPLPLLKAHGARPTRTPGPSAAMAGVLAQRTSPPEASATAPSAAPAEPAAVPEDQRCRSTPLDVDKTPPTAQVLYGHWHRLKQDRRFPAATEIDTAQVREAVARLCLLAPENGDFVYRACGRAVQRRLGMRVVCKTLADCHPPEAAERFRADVKSCLDSGEPRCHLVRNDPLLPGNKFVELLLPLADETGTAAFVLAYRHVPGG